MSLLDTGGQSFILTLMLIPIADSKSLIECLFERMLEI